MNRVNKKLFLSDLVDRDDLKTFLSLRIIAPNGQKVEIVGVNYGTGFPSLNLQNLDNGEIGECDYDSIDLLLKCEVIQNENY